jgi:hypothetical protein
MTEAVVQEYVRCAYCKRPVIKQKFCPRCGNILIKDDESPPKVDEKMVEEKTPEKPIATRKTQSTNPEFRGGKKGGHRDGA